jgi:hypothetical protein
MRMPILTPIRTKEDVRAPIRRHICGDSLLGAIPRTIVSYLQVTRIQILAARMGIKANQIAIPFIALACISNQVTEFEGVCSTLCGVDWGVVHRAVDGIAWVVLADELEEDVGFDVTGVGIVVEPVGDREIVLIVVCPEFVKSVSII